MTSGRQDAVENHSSITPKLRIMRGRVRKQVTNGSTSKTAVMDVISFLCVSLGSSTVQLHEGLGNRRACICSIVKMATVLEGNTTEEQRSIVSFLWVEGPNVKDDLKEMFPVYGGKCFSRKAVQPWWQTFR
jgi:hypothetical protein